MEPISAYGYAFIESGKPLSKHNYTIDSVTADDVVVQIAGCGLCHTDVTFYTGQVKTKKEPPIILGHEISGKVVGAGSNHQKLLGTHVVVPAVLPCGECDLCRGGRSNICMRQKMPGNDFNGGFASHITVPGRYLCPLPEDTGALKVSEFSVVADAITTPYQSLLRSNLKEGDLAVVIGVGGIGTYMLQHVKNAGAEVIAIDIDEKKLENARRMGADHTVSAKELAERDVKKAVKNLVSERKLPRTGWKVFETSGTAGGQSMAFSLLTFAGTLGVVGFTMDKVNVRLSNIMAFDADVFGNWGCKPEYYPDVVKDVIAGRINVRDNIEEQPLDSINEIFPLALHHKLERRVIFVP
jgi:6-hydroxycyclohex-1-ene-1-carbonyl-CoA dehydrogenase